jgi:hypothetical protein
MMLLMALKQDLVDDVGDRYVMLNMKNAGH